jgi:hypothetical protein
MKFKPGDWIYSDDFTWQVISIDIQAGKYKTICYYGPSAPHRPLEVYLPILQCDSDCILLTDEQKALIL